MKSKNNKKPKPVLTHYNESKICPTCKRVFYNRKKWESRNMWSKVIYCSDACRRK